MLRPAGSPVTAQLNVRFEVSLPVRASDTSSPTATGRDTGSPTLFCWSAMAARVTADGIVSVKLSSAASVPSVAVTVTTYGPDRSAPGAGVPVIWPVLGLMLSPGGRPRAL